MSELIHIYLTGLALAFAWTNGAMVYAVVKHNDTPEWETIAKEWSLSLLWPASALLLAWVWTLEGIRYALHGK